MNASWTRNLVRLAAAAALLLAVSPVFGQQRDEYGDVAVSDNGQTVARISHLQGNASYARGDQPDDWQPADVNVPMTNGDRVYTDRRTRLELQIEGGDAVRLGGQTDLVALNLTDDTRQFALKTGVASFQVHQLDSNDVFEVDTPNAAVTFDSAGDYRFDIDQDGNTRVSVRRGRASVAAGGGEVPLQSGDAMLIDGGDNPRYDVVSLRGADGWDQWVDERQGQYTRSASYRYVNQAIPGGDDLDQYGRWQQIPNYGYAWSPSSIDTGWSPYTVGHWGWQDPWGWTWISSEPWGWAPYHYGRWVTYSSRWYWIPGASVARVAYAPACVAFVGGSPGVSVAVNAGPASFVGWFPLGPSEPIIPWWSAARPVTQVNITNITYVNKTYVTVVNQNTFVSAQPVYRSIVTDRTVVQQVAAAPIVRGRVPYAPTMQSTRVSLRTETAVARPPAAVVQRAVVARVAPPPAPPRFDQKLAAIRQTGTPVAPTQAARIAVQERAQPAAAVAVRPVATESGRVTLAPRTAAAGTTAPGTTAPRPAPTPRPVAAAPVAGRALATREQPVATAPVAGPRTGRAPAASREIQNPAAETRNAPAAAAPVAPAPSPARPETQPVRPGTESREVLRPTPARPQIERNEAEPRSAPPAVRPQNEPQDQRRVATPDFRGRSNERNQEAPPNQPQRRIVTPPQSRNEPPNRPQDEARPVEPRRAAPTAREAEPRSREEIRPTPSRENGRAQQEERAAPPERSSRENPNGNSRENPNGNSSSREAPRRPTAHPRPTPEKPDR